MPYYEPHSDETRGHYERLLLEVRRCLPPGSYDVEGVAQDVLAIVCAPEARADTSRERVQRVQAELQGLLDRAIPNEVRDSLMRYGALLTDYVAAGVDEEGEDEGGRGRGGKLGAGGGLSGLGIDIEAGPSSSGSSSSSDDDSEALLAGMPVHGRQRLRKDKKKKKKESQTDGEASRRQKLKRLKQDKSLVQYAFDADTTGGDGDGDGDGETQWDDDEGEDNFFYGTSKEADGEGAPRGGEPSAAAKKALQLFNDVACNAHYVADTLRRLFPSQQAEAVQASAQRVVEYLAAPSVDSFTLETQLTAFLGGYDSEEVLTWVGEAVAGRWGIVYGLQYARCQTQKEKTAVMDRMQAHAAEDRAVELLYQGLTGKEADFVKAFQQQRSEQEVSGGAGERREPPLRRIDLLAQSFQDERTPHQHVRAAVPAGTRRLTYETHDEVVLPPTAAYNKTDPLVPLSAFPLWAQSAFPQVTSLNPMQSKVYPSAFLSDENMLVSAPTGAGKTNVATMAMLRAVYKAMRTDQPVDKTRDTTAATASIDKRELKMVYVAPMKALVQEVVRTFTARLAPLGLTVVELSGDSSMTQQQLMEAQLIVTTPEKWDIITRKSVELGVAAMIQLIIIDEVHLLHNERGPVLEAIVARTMLQQQLRGRGGVRIVGLSATLPNYADVASFLQVDRQRGLFVFDSSYRPIPLEQTYCAVKRVKGTNQTAVMNKVVYEKVLQAAMDNEQSMIFVHSRKETEYTALYLRQRAMEEKRRHNFVRDGGESEQVLRDAAREGGLRHSLQQLLPHGFAIHHAGLSKEERQVVEELFAARHIRVLVCTSTLAWGVNLPANQVIIKGTRVFSGAKAEAELLSALDVLQMFGRAGRVGFGATVGRAAIITTAEDLHYYLCVLNQQLPIESQMMKRVVDMLNAEIVLGHVTSTKEGVEWLKRTYLYVRMRQVPEVYSIRPSDSDPLLLQHLENIVHTACEELKRSRMCEYEAAARRCSPTAYGRIASYCYVTAGSMFSYLSHLSNAMQEVDLFRVFALSSEFAHITVRAEEQAQMKELLASAPIAVRDSRYTPLAKINLLLQCYISRKDLVGLPLMSELVYIKDSAQRILRALYEICLVRQFGRTARQMLQLYLMVLHRQWAVQSPVRQVREVVSVKGFEAVLSTLEGRVPWEEVRLWSLEDLQDKLGDERRAQVAHDLVQHVPHFAVEASLRPLARSMLYADVDITPTFRYSEDVHGNSAREVLLLVELPSGRLIHYETVLLPLSCLENGETYACPPLVVPMVEPKPTHLFIRVVSTNWLAAEATAAVCLLNTRLPDLAPALLEAPAAAGAEEEDVAAVLGRYGLSAVAEKIFPFEHFHSWQRPLVPLLMESTQNLFVGAPPGAGKTAVAEVFTLSFLLGLALAEEADTEEEKKEPSAPARKTTAKLLYITSNEDVAERHFMDWKFKFGDQLQQRVVLLDRRRSTLPAETAALLSGATIVVAAAASLLSLVRRGDAVLRDVTHIIADHVHLIRAAEGRFLEECLSRLNAEPLLVHHGQQRARLLALSYPLISALEVGRWLRVPAANQFNHGVAFRQLQVITEELELPGPRARSEASMAAVLRRLQRPPYAQVPVVVFVPSGRDAEQLAKRVLLRCRDFVPEAAVEDTMDDGRLALYLAAGVAYLHRGTTLLDTLNILERVDEAPCHPVTQQPLPLVLVCAFEAAGRLPAAGFPHAFVCPAERPPARQAASATAAAADAAVAAVATTDCAVSEVLLMTSRAQLEAVVYCRPARRWMWAHLLNEPLPLESYLRYPDDFRETVNAAIAQGAARHRADVLRVLRTHYFLYHLRSNLHFYGVPTADDIPLFASDFAFHVTAGLAAQGCIEVLRSDGKRTAAGGGEQEAEEDDDPHAVLRPTPRGIALAHHCISVDTMERLTAALTERADQQVSLGPLRAAQLWGLVARHAAELTPAYLGDAARVMEAAETDALHTIARALPAEMGVSYLELDFHEDSAKVFLLLLAYCGRLFRRRAAAAGAHPFAAATAVSAAERQLLLDIPAAVAARLQEDVYGLLPSVLHVLGALVEVLDGQRFAAQAHTLMALSQCAAQQVWLQESAVLQLPSLQALLGGTPAAAAALPAGLTLATLREGGAAAAAAVQQLAAAAQRQESYVRVGGAAAAADAATVAAEAAQLPALRSLRATGEVREVDGLLALVLEMEGEVVWQPRAPRAQQPPCNEEEEEPDPEEEEEQSKAEGSVAQWWLSAWVHEKQQLPPSTKNTSTQPPAEEPFAWCGPQAHLIALRRSALPPSPANTSGVYPLKGTLLFSLSKLELEGNLDALTVRVVATNCGCRAEGETEVTFATPTTSA